MKKKEQKKIGEYFSFVLELSQISEKNKKKNNFIPRNREGFAGCTFLQEFFFFFFFLVLVSCFLFLVFSFILGEKKIIYIFLCI